MAPRAIKNATSSRLRPFSVRTSIRLQLEANKKSLDELMEAADEYVSPTQQKPRKNAHYDGIEACGNILLGMEWMLRLCEKTRRMSRSQNHGIVGIYVVDINEVSGTCSLYFVGTIKTILSALRKIDNCPQVN